MAKELLEAHSQEYTEIAIDKDNEAKTYVKGFAKTVPQIFHKEQLIGGYEELVKYLK
jgi:glutaredoxin